MRSVMHTGSAYLRGVLEEGVREIVHELVGVVNAICELPDDPDHRGLRLRLVERIKVLAECGDDALVLPWVSTEDVFDDDNGLLDDVGHFRLDEFEERLYASICCGLYFDRESAN